MGLFNLNQHEQKPREADKDIVGSLIQMDATNEVLMWKYPSDNIRRGAVIKVHQNQRALLYLNGQRIDNIGPGRELVVDSANIPGLGELANVATGGETSYPLQVWFANTRCEHNVKLGITVADGILYSMKNPATNRVLTFPMTGFGSYRFRLQNPETYADKLVGTTHVATVADADCFFDDQIKVLVVDTIQEIIIQTELDIRQLIGASQVLNETIRDQANEQLRLRYGIELTAVNLRFNSPAYQKYVQEGLEGAGQENRLANMGQFYDKENQYDILKKAAANEGAGNVMGVGMGFGMGNQMGQMMGQMTQGMASQMAAGRTVPPPIPGLARSFYVAAGGQPTGPFDLGSLQTKIAQGEVGATTLVWAEGMAQWQPADSVPELAAMLRPTPPPVPPVL